MIKKFLSKYFSWRNKGKHNNTAVNQIEISISEFTVACDDLRKAADEVVNVLEGRRKTV